MLHSMQLTTRAER